MAKVTLPFWNAGQSFEPKVYAEDLADYEDAEAAALETKRASALIKAKAAFVEKILARTTATVTTTTPPLAPSSGSVTTSAGSLTIAPLRLTAAQVNHAWHELWLKGQDGRDPTAPLGQPGASSAPSSSPE